MEERRQENYTIMEGYELPSKGEIYDVKVNPHVELRSMSARDEMKRLAPSTTQFKTLADIIENCMIEKPAIHVYDMCLGDYEFLLHKLRIVTYGGKYKMLLACPFCGETNDITFNLEDLELKEFDINKYNELRTIILPRSGHTVSIKFQTPRMLDEQELKVREMKKKYKDADIDFGTLVLLSSIIDTVDGVKLDPLKMESFVEKLPALDMAKILNNLDEINKSIGIDTKIQVPCPVCDNEINAFFRFGPEFFRPTTI